MTAERWTAEDFQATAAKLEQIERHTRREIRRGYTTAALTALAAFFCWLFLVAVFVVAGFAGLALLAAGVVVVLAGRS